MESDESKIMKTIASEASQLSHSLNDLRDKNTRKTDLLTTKISEAEKILEEVLAIIVKNTHLNSLKKKNEVFFNVTDSTCAQLEKISSISGRIQFEINEFQKTLNTRE